MVMGYFMSSFVCTFTLSVHPPHPPNANVTREETCGNIGQKTLRSSTAAGTERGMAPQYTFDPHTFLAKIGTGRTIMACQAQGEAADAVCYIQEGPVKLTVVSEHGKEGKAGLVMSRISQETLAEMIGTTRSRVSFFLNKFRRLGFIDYNGGMHVHSALLNVILYD
jgi:CRP-like cAMP-binding protein